MDLYSLKLSDRTFSNNMALPVSQTRVYQQIQGLWRLKIRG